MDYINFEMTVINTNMLYSKKHLYKVARQKEQTNTYICVCKYQNHKRNILTMLQQELQIVFW